MSVNPIDYPRVLFSETQRFRKPLEWVLMILFLLVPMGLTVILWRVLGLQNLPRLLWATMLIAFAAPFVALAFSQLTVTVSTDQTFVRFFVFRRRIPHMQVEAFEPMKYHWTDFGGWGARWDGDKTWAYTVSGDRAVRLHLSSGKRVVIGSQRADELIAALEEAGITRMPERRFTPLA